MCPVCNSINKSAEASTCALLGVLLNTPIEVVYGLLCTTHRYYVDRAREESARLIKS